MKKQESIVIQAVGNGWIIHNYSTEGVRVVDPVDNTCVFNNFNHMVKFLKKHFVKED